MVETVTTTLKKIKWKYSADFFQVDMKMNDCEIGKKKTENGEGKEVFSGY